MAVISLPTASMDVYKTVFDVLQAVIAEPKAVKEAIANMNEAFAISDELAASKAAAEKVIVDAALTQSMIYKAKAELEADTAAKIQDIVKAQAKLESDRFSFESAKAKQLDAIAFASNGIEKDKENIKVAYAQLAADKEAMLKDKALIDTAIAEVDNFKKTSAKVNDALVKRSQDLDTREIAIQEREDKLRALLS